MASSRNSAPADGRGSRLQPGSSAEMPSTPSPSRRERGDSSRFAGDAAESGPRWAGSDRRNDAVVEVITAVEDALDAYVASDARVAVAFSGGIDSMVLLDALVHVSLDHSLQLSAIHVHHGLSPNADQWARFCAEQCASRAVPLTVHRLHLTRKSGQSLEALARAERYERFMSCDVDVIALAHHADDQAETVLLQLLRGSGPRGLSAMPAIRRGMPALLRPLLSLPRATLPACGKARGPRACCGNCAALLPTRAPVSRTTAPRSVAIAGALSCMHPLPRRLRSRGKAHLKSSCRAGPLYSSVGKGTGSPWRRSPRRR